MSTENHYYVERTEDGRYAVRSKVSDRALGIFNTQREAIERAKELNPHDQPDVERVRDAMGEGRFEMNTSSRRTGDWAERIVQDPKICGGEPVFKGTRVTLRTILASLADGDSTEVILRSFPSLNPEDVRAAIAFAAASAEEDLPVPAVPPV